MKRWCVLFLAVLAVSGLKSLPAQASSNAEKMADTVLSRWPEGRINTVNPPQKWNYEEGVLLQGITDVWYSTADGKYFRYVQKATDKYVQPDGSIATYAADEDSLDNIPLGRQLLLLSGVTANAKYYKAATTLWQQLHDQPRTPSGGFWHKKRYPQQMWLDGLYMAEPFYAEYAATFHHPEAFDDIAHQFTLIEEHTRDPKTGLLYHAWDEAKLQPWGNPQTGDSQNFWARADGWYAMALVDTLDYFPQDHPGRAQLIAILNRLAKALVHVQDPATGLWYQVMDKPQEKGNYLESSAACMFVYALQKGVRKGYLPVTYSAHAQKAYESILRRFVQTEPDGQLTLTGTVKSAGLGGTPNRDGTYHYYISEPVVSNDSKGIGAFLMAATEMEKAPTATLGAGKTVLLDAWFNSQKHPDPTGQEVFFHYKWNDLANSGYSFWGETFKSYGAKLATLCQAPKLAGLKQAQVYIISSPDIPAKNPHPNYMTSEDAKEVAEWVHQGGVLVLMENDVNNSEFEHFNTLSDIFGIHFNPVLRNQVEGNKFEMGRVLITAGNPIFPGTHNFYMKEISTITPSGPAKPVLADKDVLMAVARYGKGTVFAMVDPWIYNEYVDGRKLPLEYDNYAGAKELSEWLLKQASGSSVASLPGADHKHTY
jgi:unsaturated rhamnogalacturonyl hydrolase